MIEAIEHNLKRGIRLLESLTDEQYSNDKIPPYYSSIGTNVRHILDAFNCIFDGIVKNEIDFSNRQRNTLCEKETSEGIKCINTVIDKLQEVDKSNFSQLIKVTDDLGTGKLTVNYTLESTLIYAHSHTIHHFANIGFLIHQLAIALPFSDFGYNPTTPKKSCNLLV